MKLTSTTDGFEFEAYHAAPRDARRGGLVLIHEIFGVTRGVRELADGFAETGYEVLTPQLFDRVEPDYEAERSPESIAQGREFIRLVGWENALGDVQACIDALQPPVFVVGFCYGGTVAWLAAARCEGLTAVSAFYGGGIAGFVNERPQVPIILHFGKEDANIPQDHWDRISAAHPDTPLYLYDAGHGFFAHDRSDYKAAPAELARLRTLQFFHQAASGQGEL